MYNPSTMDYFKHPDRQGETTDIQDVCKTVYDNIYNSNDRKESKRLKHYSNFESHPFLKILIEHFNSPKTIEGEQTKCNLVFADYLCKIAKIARRHILLKFVTYVTLFRECLNLSYNNKNTKDDSNKENSVVKDISETINDQLDYSELNNAEDAPDVSNEFVTDFLESDPNFFDLDKEEIIEITQNFCSWLYDNNYTCSKLSLINN